MDTRSDDESREGAAGLDRLTGDLRPRQRALLIVLGFIGLVVGVAAGLARLGYRVPSFALSATPWHGPLMIGGFFGVVIALERAVALGRRWAYAGPLLAGLGGVAVAVGKPAWSPWLLLAGSLLLLTASADVFRRQRALFTLTLLLGAACWTIGNLRWSLGAAVPNVVSAWLAFLVLTIAGERLELTRFLPPSGVASSAFATIVVAIGVGLFDASSPVGTAIFAAGLFMLSIWLLKHDIARRTVRTTGLPRFIATCVLSGYAWLAIGAATMLAAGFAAGTRSYDAAIHAIALGFVFAMVFGHAPLIIPAVLKVPLPYHSSFYVPLMLLHGSLALRFCGDMADHVSWIRTGAMLNVFGLAAFVIAMLSAALREHERLRHTLADGAA